ncbi:MAG: enoyl-CoA hydratase/isomerase family protein [Chlamydiia bacterium]|nr:enoyl-CoA hydratase/isomerase family protein [Chlamydiia bacterium]
MEHLIIEQNNAIVTVKINRPKVLNALNRALLEELLNYMESCSKNNNVKALILTGEGEKAFIAGADIKEMRGMTHLEMLGFCELGQRVANTLEAAPFLTIAAVNGYALGGGLEMALACDFIYANNKAKLGLPEVTLGIIPGFGGTQRLSRAVGTRLAKEMIMTGNIINAETAEKIGIVNHLCPQENLLEDCYATAGKVASHSLTAVVQAKNAINYGYHLGMREALELERNICAVCFATDERAKEMDDFVNKRGKHA